MTVRRLLTDLPICEVSKGDDRLRLFLEGGSSSRRTDFQVFSSTSILPSSSRSHSFICRRNSGGGGTAEIERERRESQSWSSANPSAWAASLLYRVKITVYLLSIRIGSMPALKMKIKSMASCVSEGSFDRESSDICKRMCCEVSDCLDVHRESSEICKRKRCMVSEPYEMLGVELKRICHDGPCEVDIVKETMLDESTDVESDNIDDSAIQQRLSPSEDTSLIERKDSTVQCPSNVDVSPSVDSTDTNRKLVSSDSPVGEECLAKAQLSMDNSGDKNLDSARLQASQDLDNFISAMSMAPLPSEGACELDDVIRISFFQEFECAEPNLTFDIADSSIISSSLDQPAFQGRECTNELLTSADNSWFQLVAQQTKSCDQAVNSSASMDSDEAEFFDPHSFIRNILDLSDLETSSLPALLPKESCERKRITLVLDLDETLIHSTTQPCDDADFSFKIFFNMEEHTVYVRQRPFLKAFLERVSEMFEVVIFTASESIYAGQLLDMLDPEKKFFSRRAYRDSCVVINGNYTKDLTILGVDLARVAIVDNCPQVFQLQVSNGIPIQSWFDDPSDRALLSLLPFLDTLAEADDVRPIISRKYGVKE